MTKKEIYFGVDGKDLFSMLGELAPSPTKKDIEDFIDVLVDRIPIVFEKSSGLYYPNYPLITYKSTDLKVEIVVYVFGGQTDILIYNKTFWLYTDNELIDMLISNSFGFEDGSFYTSTD